MTPHTRVLSVPQPVAGTLGAVLLLITLAWAGAAPAGPRMDDAEALRLGQRVWHNETGGRMDRLLWWNRGEDFASLGIGHFIWYPRHGAGPFEETFPALVAFLREGGAELPPWLDTSPPPPCPWSTREAFLDAADDPRRLELEELLRRTIPAQSRFLVRRLRQAVPRLLEAVPAARRPVLRRRIDALLATPEGRYALVDYVNFKGEGLNPAERYRGEGWGLLQVLEAMTGEGPAGADFGRAAERVLTRRVANADPARNEARWLPGWRRRVASYGGDGE